MIPQRSSTALFHIMEVYVSDNGNNRVKKLLDEVFGDAPKERVVEAKVLCVPDAEGKAWVDAMTEDGFVMIAGNGCPTHKVGFVLVVHKDVMASDAYRSQGKLTFLRGNELLACLRATAEAFLNSEMT